VENLEIIVLALLIVVNVPVYFIVFKLIYGDVERFVDSIQYAVRPNFLAYFSDDYYVILMPQAQLSVFFIGCAAIVGAEFALLMVASGVW